MKKINFLLSFIALAIVMIACSTTLKNVATSNTEIQNKKWILNGIEGKNFNANGREAFIIFSDTMKMGGVNGCNNFGGKYSLKDNFQIAMNDIYSTKMACVNQNNPEQKFMSNLLNTNNWIISNNQLYLQKDGTWLLRFKSE